MPASSPKHVLIDGGPLAAFEVLDRRIESLPGNPRHIDLMVVTHIAWHRNPFRMTDWLGDDTVARSLVQAELHVPHAAIRQHASPGRGS